MEYLCIINLYYINFISLSRKIFFCGNKKPDIALNVISQIMFFYHYYTNVVSIVYRNVENEIMRQQIYDFGNR